MLGFRNVLIAKKFMDKREGEYQDFPAKVFCMTEPKHLVEESFCAGFQKISDSLQVYG